MRKGTSLEPQRRTRGKQRAEEETSTDPEKKGTLRERERERKPRDDSGMKAKGRECVREKDVVYNVRCG